MSKPCNLQIMQFKGTSSQQNGNILYNLISSRDNRQTVRIRCEENKNKTWVTDLCPQRTGLLFIPLTTYSTYYLPTSAESAHWEYSGYFWKVTVGDKKKKKKKAYELPSERSKESILCKNFPSESSWYSFPSQDSKGLPGSFQPWVLHWIQVFSSKVDIKKTV